MNNESKHANSAPLVFGDISVVRYPNGNEMLGGHAFGIAWHLRGLAQSVLLVSRIGDDAAGDEAVQALEAWDVPTVGIQRAVAESTGSLEVQSDDAAESTLPACHQPWERISAEESLHALRTTTCALIIHGTRCLRTSSNRKTLDRLVADTRAPIYFDAAIDAALERTDLERCLNRSSWVGMQKAELVAIGKALGLAAGDLEGVAERLVRTFDISVLYVVDDVNGSFAVTASGERYAALPSGDLDVIDRVGIREAFTAVAAYGVLGGWSVPVTLRRAQGFVELVAALPAPAIPAAALYDDVRRQWAVETDLDERIRTDDSVVTASAPIPEEDRLPARIERATETLDELRERQQSARMRASIASDVAVAGDSESHRALVRAERSVKTIGERIEETEHRIRTLRRTARESRAADTTEGTRERTDVQIEGD